mgnify:CR=1 FL=1
MNQVIVIDFKNKRLKERFTGVLDLDDPKHRKHLEERADALLQADGDSQQFVSVYDGVYDHQMNWDPMLEYGQPYDDMDFERECSQNLRLVKSSGEDSE